MEVVVQAGWAMMPVVAPTAHRAGIRDDRAAACHRLLEETRHAACPEIVVERFGLERPVREEHPFHAAADKARPQPRVRKGAETGRRAAKMGVMPETVVLLK